MTAMTEGPVPSPLPAASLLLEAFPRASIVGGPARPGAGEHQIGGYPAWIHESFFPRVPGTKRGMMFVGASISRRRRWAGSWADPGSSIASSMTRPGSP